MARLTLYKDNYSDSTVVSNIFIDQYMKDANDAQLKIYFYLIRMLNANQPISVSGIADKFNHTEKDVIRALQYWEKMQLLNLEYDEEMNLAGIHLRDLNAPAGAEASPAAPRTQITSIRPIALQEAAPQTSVLSPVEAKADKSLFTKPVYTLDQLKEFKNRQETAQLLFIVESYIGRPLTPSDIKTILFFTDELHFSEDMIDYLIQYCVDRDKKDFKYIEKVAVNWAEHNISTPKQAEKYASKYDKNVYAIMNELGKSNSPTAKEMEYITRWTKEYCFSTDIILEACQRTVLATDKHRFEYAESILNSWHQENVHHKADILKMDALYQKKRNAARPAVSNKFNQFAQNQYDFDILEREILSN